MITFRRADDPGRTELDWLTSRHTFSFGGYMDRAWMGYSVLRVINDDRVAPGRGFGMHPHRDMEILTWILDGALEHKDSLGSGSVIRPGDLQHMSAGTGVVHSEWNPSTSQPTHFLQIWLLPGQEGLAPRYDQLRIEPEALRGRLAPVASGRGVEGALPIHQDADLLIGELPAGAAVSHRPEPGRRAWAHVARGRVEILGRALGAGDGVGISGEEEVPIAAVSSAHVLVFDLP